MTDTEFDNELKHYLSGLIGAEKEITETRFHLSLQPAMTSFGGDFVLNNNETLPIDIKRKGRASNSHFAEKINSYHRASTNNGLNKWNKAIFTINNKGEIKREFVWDENWEQEELDAYNRQAESARAKWYWDEK